MTAFILSASNWDVTSILASCGLSVPNAEITARVAHCVAHAAIPPTEVQFTFIHRFVSSRFAVFGDFGNDNAQSLPRIQQEVQRGRIDAILHVGDMAYDMDTVSTFK